MVRDVELQGVFPTMATPLNADGELDETALRTLLRRVKAHADGVVVLGSAGEGPVLPDRIRWRVVEVALDELGRDRPLIMGTSSLSLAEAICTHRRAKALGVRAALTLPPFYFTLRPVDVVNFYERLAGEGDLDIIVYHFPNTTKITLPVDSVEQLIRADRVVGIKDSSGDMGFFQNVVQRSQGTSFSVFQGRAFLVAISLMVGASGCITPVGVVDPTLEVRLLRAVREGRYEEALACQRTVTYLASLLNYRGLPLPIGLKAVLSVMGMCRPDTVPPLPRLADDDLSYLATQLNSLGLLGAAGGSDTGR